MDFNEDILFRASTADLCALHAMHFSLHQRDKVNKFLAGVENHLRYKNIQERIGCFQVIVKEVRSGIFKITNEDLQRICDSIAADVDDAMIVGEKSATKNYVGFMRSMVLTSAAAMV